MTTPSVPEHRWQPYTSMYQTPPPTPPSDTMPVLTPEAVAAYREQGRAAQVAAKSKKLLTPREVAARFRVDPKTVTRWAAAGKLPSVRTPGGHRRFYAEDVDALLGAPPEEDE